MGAAFDYAMQWWTRVHGPAQLRRSLAESAGAGGCILLHHSAPLPWAEALRALVQEEVQNGDSRRYILPAMDCTGLENTGEDWFLETFAPECAGDYLSAMTFARFLAGRGALDGKMIWLYGMDEAGQERWVERLAEFALQKEAGRCVFLLETTGRRPPRKKKLRTLEAGEFIRPFDVKQLATMAVGEGSENTGEKDYLSSLCIELAGEDPEGLPWLLSDREGLLRGPVGRAQAALGLSEERAAHHVRRAQLQLLLPLVEDLRLALLERNARACQTLLPFEDEFGNHCESLYQIELRHLIHYRNRGEFFLPAEEWERVRLPYEARNKLMHELQPLDFALLRQVLEMAQTMEMGNW